MADYYIKLLQVSLFKKMRDILMGLAPFPDEERVGLCNTSVKSSGTKIKPLTVIKNKAKTVTYADALRTDLKNQRKELHAIR